MRSTFVARDPTLFSEAWFDSLVKGVLDGEAFNHGGNSSIYRAVWSDRVVALKRYGAHLDFRKRAEREWNALTYLWNSGSRIAPEPIAAKLGQGLVLMEWVHQEGEFPLPSAGEALGILDQLQSLTSPAGQQQIGPAADAIDSPQDLLVQAERRLEILSSEFPLDGLLDFFRAQLEVLKVSLRGGRRASNILSPSDFGPHNLLRSADGLRLIDLEFFGWDDSHKLVADTLLHPLNSWTRSDRVVFAEKTRELYDLDEGRLSMVAQGCSLKWATIVLKRALRLYESGDSDEYENALGLARSYASRALESGAGLEL
jgi:hypothetical protein